MYRDTSLVDCARSIFVCIYTKYVLVGQTPSMDSYGREVIIFH